MDAKKNNRRIAVHLNCPHCQNPIEIVAGEIENEVLCPSCGSSFHLDPDRTAPLAQDTLVRLGKFELIEPVGRGAVGTVYRARDSELERIVAIKVPRSGQLATREDEDRFTREARNAAQLHHAGIVPVFHVGRSDECIYIVSEFVDGMTLGDELTSRRLGFREAAQLVAQVAAALQHAHTQGVVHRDLKPSNIMLTPEGTPRVMDFGLAKRDAGEITMTVEGQLLGTPAYMSPEQASGQGHHVDGRSDVYSLGVILFELMTGELPFRGNARMLLHNVIHNDPRAPRGLNDRIPRDLETICLKAMTKEPKGRYQTAEALADDLDRWLSGHAIVARPVGRVERGWRWCRRNRLAALLGAAVILTFALGAAVSGVFAVQSSRRADEAERLAKLEHEAREQAAQSLLAAQVAQRVAQDARSAAETQGATAHRISEFLVDLFMTADPIATGKLGFRQANEVGTKLTLRELLDRGSEKVRHALKEQPVVRAALLDTLGKVYSDLGLIDQAEPLVQEAYDIRIAHSQNEEELATSTLNLGVLRRWQGEYSEAERLHRLALEKRIAISGRDSFSVAEAEVALGWTIMEKQLIHPNVGSSAVEFDELMQHAVKIQVHDLGSWHRDVAVTRILMALRYFMHGDQAKGEQTMALAVAGLLHEEEGRTLVRGIFEYERAASARKLGQYANAEAHYRASLDVFRAIWGSENLVTLVIAADRGGMFREQGRMAEFERNGRELLESGLHVVRRGHPIMIPAINDWTPFIVSQGKFDEAARLVEMRISLEQRFNGPSPIRDAHSKLQIADYRLTQGRLEDCGRLLDEVGATLDDLPEADKPLEISHRWVQGALSGARGDIAGQENICRECISAAQAIPIPTEGLKCGLADLIQMQRPFDPEIDTLLSVPIIRANNLSPNYPDGADQYLRYARVLIDRGDFDGAAPFLKHVSDFVHHKTMPGSYWTGQADSLMGAWLAAKGRPDEAEPLLLAGVENLKKSRSEHHRLTHEALGRLVSFYRQVGRASEAEPFAKLLSSGTTLHSDE